MTLVLLVPVDDDGATFVEVEVDRHTIDEDAMRLAAGDRNSRRAAFSLGSAVDRVIPALSAVTDRLRSAENPPDEVSVEVGLTVGGETGIVLAKGTAGATFAVRMVWSRPPATGPAV